MKQPPDETVAADIAHRHFGERPTAVRRFSNGAQHYVYEAFFAARESVVVRVAVPEQRHAMLGASVLSTTLRPLGVPLPRMLSSGLDDPYPWLLLERLRGTDLGDVIAGLTRDALDRIASGVAQAQRNAAEVGAASRFGYAVQAEDAPHRVWSDVLRVHIARSRERIVRAGFYEVALIQRLEEKVEAFREKLDLIKPVPFLHDTTLRNVIVSDDGMLSGIVDVDDLCFGDPRYPIALTLAVSMARGSPEKYASRWLHHAGYRDDVLFRLYVAAYLLDLMSEHGQIFNGNERPSTSSERERLLSLYLEAFDYLA